MTPKRFFTVAFMAALAVGVLWSGPARGQGSGFLIDGADQTVYNVLTGSPTLNGWLDALGTHFVIDNADSLRHAPLVFPLGLQGALDGLPVHFVLDMADSNRFNALAYPLTLIGDVTPPQETTTPIVAPSGSSVKIRWQTNEFSRGTIAFGTQPGNYTRSVAEPLFAQTHELTLTGLSTETPNYYRITHVDRAGNSASGPERSFMLGAESRMLYLPLAMGR